MFSLLAHQACTQKVYTSYLPVCLLQLNVVTCVKVLEIPNVWLSHFWPSVRYLTLQSPSLDHKVETLLLVRCACARQEVSFQL